VKNFMKEETMPGDVNKPLFILAPALAFVPRR
jgi:NADH:ubiquinone oxidoreductase subunit H